MKTLIAVDWYKEDADGWHGMRECDLCQGAPLDDFAEGKEPRQFYLEQGPEGLIICQHCLQIPEGT